MANAARTVNTDPFHVFNFKVIFQKITGGEVGIVGGFTTCTLPEETVEVVEFKDSTMKYKQKYPGIPSVSDITLTRGVIKGSENPNGSTGSSLPVTQGVGQSAGDPAYHLFNMLKTTQDFGTTNDYRFNLEIQQHHRDGKARIYHLHNCVCTRFKTSTDLDANASDIAVEELDISYEFFDMETKSGATTGVIAETKI